LPRKKTFKAIRTNAPATSSSTQEQEQEQEWQEFPFEGAAQKFSIVNLVLEKPALEVVPEIPPKGLKNWVERD
jgi:hypothetical protein